MRARPTEVPKQGRLDWQILRSLLPWVWEYRFRSGIALLLLVAELCGYMGPRRIQLGAAIELLHTATLLHDDVVDLSELRRGRPSANAIWGRMKDARLTGPRKIIWASDDDLRAVGLSRQKMRYARALAEARIDFDSLRSAPTDEVIATLVEVPGIGAWTAEIYAMFSLGRADVFAPGDLALQESARILFDLPARPKDRELRAMAEDWAPWRSVAARLLWAYYRVAKDREGIR